MTISAASSRISYNCDEETTVFPFNFKVFESGDIKVVLRDSDLNETTLETPANYKVTKSGNTFENGGNVETQVESAGEYIPYAYPAGNTLLIIRDLELSQDMDYVPGGSFPAESHEKALDRLTMIAQQLKEAIGRAIKFKVSSSKEAMIGTSAVAQAKLKTSTSTDSDTAEEAQQNGTSLLTGGEYGFMVQAKGNNANMKFAYGYTEAAKITDSTTGYASATYAGPYISWGWIRTDGWTNHVFYLQQRYVTSSGEVNWLFVLRDKGTKKVKRVNFASDHPCFGHGGDPISRPHPWVGCNVYDPDTMEIIVINPTDKEIKELLGEYPDCENIVEVFHNYLEIDETDKPWPKKKVTVGLPKGTNWKSERPGTSVTPVKKTVPKPDYIKVKSLRKK